MLFAVGLVLVVMLLQNTASPAYASEPSFVMTTNSLAPPTTTALAPTTAAIETSFTVTFVAIVVAAVVLGFKRILDFGDINRFTTLLKGGRHHIATMVSGLVSSTTTNASTTTGNNEGTDKTASKTTRWHTAGIRASFSTFRASITNLRAGLFRPPLHSASSFA